MLHNEDQFYSSFQPQENKFIYFFSYKEPLKFEGWGTENLNEKQQLSSLDLYAPIFSTTTTM